MIMSSAKTKGEMYLYNGSKAVGATAPQIGFGAQYIGGAKQWYIINLEDLIKCQ